MYQTVSTESSSLESRYSEIAARQDETQTDVEHYQRRLHNVEQQLQQTQAELVVKERDNRDLESRVASLTSSVAEAKRQARSMDVEKTVLENQVQMNIEEYNR